MSRLATATAVPSTADDIRGLLTHVIAGVAGGAKADWRKRIVIERVSTWRFVRHNGLCSRAADQPSAQ